MPIKTLENISSGSSIDLSAIELSISNIKKTNLSPAGAGNESNYVWEDIARLRVKAYAIDGMVGGALDDDNGDGFTNIEDWLHDLALAA